LIVELSVSSETTALTVQADACSREAGYEVVKGGLLKKCGFPPWRSIPFK
jgi:hypothetical protein